MTFPEDHRLLPDAAGFGELEKLFVLNFAAALRAATEEQREKAEEAKQGREVWRLNLLLKKSWVDLLKMNQIAKVELAHQIRVSQEDLEAYLLLCLAKTDIAEADSKRKRASEAAKNPKRTTGSSGRLAAEDYLDRERTLDPLAGRSERSQLKKAVAKKFRVTPRTLSRQLKKWSEEEP